MTMAVAKYATADVDAWATTGSGLSFCYSAAATTMAVVVTMITTAAVGGLTCFCASAADAETTSWATTADANWQPAGSCKITQQTKQGMPVASPVSCTQPVS